MTPETPETPEAPEVARTRYREAVLMILAEGADVKGSALTLDELCATLWLADKAAYRATGRGITGDRHIKIPAGFLTGTVPERLGEVLSGLLADGLIAEAPA